MPASLLEQRTAFGVNTHPALGGWSYHSTTVLQHDIKINFPDMIEEQKQVSCSKRDTWLFKLKKEGNYSEDISGLVLKLQEDEYC